ncbi:MAG TPA: hypothetical protein VHU40_02895 [Polyangia bacterium]|jgi:hypothetical protein|nr:hypothetical protein [Polyangia bacterium]
MKIHDSRIEPELDSLIHPPKIERVAPPDLRRRALSRARAFVVANGGRVPAPISVLPTFASVPPAPRRLRTRLAFAAALVVGAASVGAVAAFRQRTAELAAIDSATATAPALPAPPAPRPVAAPLAVKPERIARRTRVKSGPAPRDMGGTARFTAELELLQRAQESYTRRDFSAALDLLAEHARRFSRGQLAEEREALRVRSLRGAGRSEEARRQAADFAARFPRSVLLPRLDGAEGD